MWNMKCSVIPVVIGATGTVARGLKKYPEEIPGKHSIDLLQKNSPPGNITHTKESVRCSIGSRKGPLGKPCQSCSGRGQ
jgi:hypothetical protein